jgi:hypothetical protein
LANHGLICRVIEYRDEDVLDRRRGFVKLDEDVTYTLSHRTMAPLINDIRNAFG